MVEGHQRHSEQNLAEALRALGDRVVYPPTPDLATAVRRELQANPAAPREPWWAAFFQRRTLATIAVAVVLLTALVVAAFPGARTAVADWLGLPGVTFFQSPAVETPPIGRFFLIGVPRTLDQAREEIPFTILVPTQPGLEEPDEVWVDGDPHSFTYTDQTEIPYINAPAWPATPCSGNRAASPCASNPHRLRDRDGAVAESMR